MRTASLLALTCAACAAHAPRAPAMAAAAVAHALDDFHAAAAAADEARYFALFARDGVFLGTDASERWDVAAFRAYAHPHFARGEGWTYRPRDRHVHLSRDGTVAWFDEKLDNDKYGEARGSGVLVVEDGTWRLAQYVLSFPVPNELAREIVDRIRAHRTP